MIAPLTLPSAIHIAANLRARDLEEVVATSPFGTDMQAWAVQIASLPGESICVFARDGEPVMMGGVIPLWPGHAQTWMVSTARLSEIGWQVHKAALDLHARWKAQGIRRFQAHCIAGGGRAQEWLKKLGYRIEGTHPQFGRYGQAFYTMGKVA